MYNYIGNQENAEPVDNLAVTDSALRLNHLSQFVRQFGANIQEGVLEGNYDAVQVDVV